MQLIQSAQLKTFRRNSYNKDFDWLYFDDEPRVQENQYNQQFCLVLYNGFTYNVIGTIGYF